ncbi:serine hydrolase [Chitinophaga sp. LS1]|uniref:serine hydrolase domain-containing protein n=1 Tax=Chitinophaga sp. LS1 TaxID=3051176 RepID=UPI002AAB9880|nr:serine hydrolase [Chitinophaga sp. LS1]WPV66573.1 serine hydrolase [Chitinophaga sp. LS1]
MKSPILLFLLVSISWQGFAQSKQGYFPPRGEWQQKVPKTMGLDPVKLDSAIAYAIQNESKAPRDMELAQAISFGKEPFSAGVGPFAERGAPTGIIVYKGYIVKTWGDPDRVDMTHSVTKSFLNAVIGVAVDKGLIRSVNDTVARYVPPIEVYGSGELIYPFATEHNRSLTWDVMLRQTSDWEGTLWGKPDWADRPEGNYTEWMKRPRHTPGSVWKYNDVRVNALALATTSVWRQPLPQVLKTQIMDPIGASNTWRWFGYRNSWIVLDGAPVQSVSGGGHWGGGMFINAYDMARFGLLTLHRGNWNGQQLLSEQWVKQALTPTTANTGYGYMNWFLNTDKKMLPSAPASAFVHVGNGSNLIYVDPEHDLVVVMRWIEYKAMDEMIKRVLSAL